MNKSHEAISGAILDIRTYDSMQARELLLEEYKSLRNESVTRIASRTQLVTIMVAAAGLLTATTTRLWLIILAIIFMLGAVVYYFTSKADVERIARHLATVEGQLNEIARLEKSQGSAARLASIPMSWSTKIVENRNVLRRRGTLLKAIRFR